jgi:hypothetical protein
MERWLLKKPTDKEPIALHISSIPWHPLYFIVDTDTKDTFLCAWQRLSFLAVTVVLGAWISYRTALIEILFE